MSLSEGRKRYEAAVRRIRDGRPVRSLAQVMAAHSLHIGNMARARRKGDYASVFDSWNQMESLNTRWVDLVMSPFKYRCRTQPTREHVERLESVASQMARGYTSTLAELALCGKVAPERLRNMVNAEANFYNTMMADNAGAHQQTRQQWIQHTQSVLDMLQHSDPKQFAQDDFEWAVSNCIEHGQLLGTWLDGVFLGY